MIIDADMRDLSAIPDGSFECVRNNATLHHLPLAACGLGADSAISESRRILVDGGVFQCLVKEGTGVEMTDTGEGLGRRFYQYFSAASTSIEFALSGFQEGPEFNDLARPGFYTRRHIPAIALSRLLPEWESYTSFGVIRHPHIRRLDPGCPTRREKEL